MEFPETNVDVLIVAPHPDDAELGMAGGIFRFKQQGWSVGVLELTDGEPTPHGSVEIRASETAAATAVLELDWRGNLGLPNRKLEATLEARHQLAEVFRALRPRWLFAPYWVDAHPDHLAATELVETSRFWAKLTKSELSGEPHHPAKIYYYYSVHLRLAVQPAFILDISDQWSRKRKALECYQSQLVQGREDGAVTFLDQLEKSAAHWGQLIGCQYGEPYATREPLGLKDFGSLTP